MPSMLIVQLNLPSREFLCTDLALFTSFDSVDSGQLNLRTERLGDSVTLSSANFSLPIVESNKMFLGHSKGLERQEGFVAEVI